MVPEHVLIGRDRLQKFAGNILHYKTILSPKEDSVVVDNHFRSAQAFLERHGLSDLRLEFEDLMLKSEATLRALNQALDMNLTVEDLQRVYSGRLGRKRYSAAQCAKAALIFTYWRFFRGLSDAV